MSGFLAVPAARPRRRRRLARRVSRAGVLLSIGHGVPASVDAAIQRSAREFFALPESERRALAIARSPHFRGYTALGSEITRSKRDWREQLDLGPEESALAVSPSDPPWLRLRGPNQWPASLPSMRGAVLDWMHAMDGVGVAILRALALGLGQPLEHSTRQCCRAATRIEDHSLSPQDEPRDRGQGVGMHHDSGLVSFVLQDDVGGFQVEIDGSLVDATPEAGHVRDEPRRDAPGRDSGYLRATKHRVCEPATRPRTDLESRTSSIRGSTCVFEPVELPPALAAAARGGENADPSDPVLKCFGDNYLKIRLRSHPTSRPRTTPTCRRPWTLGDDAHGRAALMPWRALVVFSAIAVGATTAIAVLCHANGWTVTSTSGRSSRRSRCGHRRSRGSSRVRRSTAGSRARSRCAAGELPARA